MKNLYLCNAFSLQMVAAQLQPGGSACNLSVYEMTVAEARDYLTGCPDGWQSAIGHADTAAVVAEILGLPVEANRASIELGPNDSLVVAQVCGGRLPEGTKTLPEGFSIRFFAFKFLTGRN